MAWLGVVGAVVLIGAMFVDSFEATILPRRVRHSYRLSRVFYQATWGLWGSLARCLPAGRWRNGFLSIFGPLSLLTLMMVWATGLIVGFAILHWSLGTAFSVPPREADDTFASYLYFSGTTFFTLGYGDLVPTETLGRGLAVAQAGIGFGFLAVVISYLPLLHQAFARREIMISLLDARAGSPPSAGELLQRVGHAGNLASTVPLLIEWERWAAEVLESHLSFPVLSFYRSQHDNQSWVGALTTILDTSALLIAGVDGSDSYQARLTFAMARHTVVDLGMVFQAPPRPPVPERLPAADLARLRESLLATGIKLCSEPEVVKVMTELRGLYEPFVNALAAHFQFPLPTFLPERHTVDNWQTSAWMRRSPGFGGLRNISSDDEHFD